MMDIAFIEIAQAAPNEVRVDTYDRKSNRTGYIIYDPKTGKFDQFDLHGNRRGYGVITNPPPAGNIERFDPKEKPAPDRNSR